jgi:hypothetical protein
MLAKHQDKRPTIHHKITKPKDKKFKKPHTEPHEQYHQSLDKCWACATPYSSTALPKILPCGHSLCEHCIQSSTTNYTITCLLCQSTHSYGVEENGFIIDKNNTIKIFDELDCLINIYNCKNYRIFDIVIDNRKNVIAQISALLRSASSDTLHYRNNELILKPIFLKQFPVRTNAAKPKQYSRIDRDLLVGFEKSLEPFNLQLKNKNIEKNAYERTYESIVLETKNKQYCIDMGRNVYSVFNLFNLLQDHTEQLSSFCSTEDSSSFKSNEEDSTDTKSYADEALTYINDHLEFLRKLKHSIEQDSPCSCTDEIRERRCRCKLEVFSSKKVNKEESVDVSEIVNSVAHLKSGDSMFSAGDIVEGCYCRRAANGRKLFSVLEDDICVVCMGQINSGLGVLLPLKEGYSLKAMYYSPLHNVRLCIRHGLEYKIRYGMRLVCLLNKRDAQQMIAQSHVREELELLVRSEYAKRLDHEHVMHIIK